METFEKILEKNMLYIYKVAKSLGHANDEELIQIGKISMYESYQKFEDKGIPFMTYAGMNMRFEMMNYLTQNSRLIHIPSNKIRENFNKKKEDKLFEYKIISTEMQLIEGDEQLTLGNSLIDEQTDDSLYSDEEISALYNCIDKLNSKQKKVLQLRLDGFSFSEIGERFDCSKETIRLIQKKALNKIKLMLKIDSNSIIKKNQSKSITNEKKRLYMIFKRQKSKENV